ncbi:TOG array regulator of axonemal microtubules protein 1-like [Astyanax mexicanus]|uniref:TOG array regulator of axonemal microtubules protein 1-like n=1 Tax=Astyanax mexicanus TaxID=7994 RepID=A0A8T2LP21_ASTMX|nr:TOG array regulator of axonemal microtubules protein 1-like [Astyanax mexicanus]
MDFKRTEGLLFPPLPPSGPRPVRRNNRQVRVLKPDWLENSFKYQELISRPVLQHPAPPPVPLPIATKPVVVNKVSAHYSPGSGIPNLDWQGRLRPVQVMGQSITTRAARYKMDKSVEVEGACREPNNIRAAPQAVERGQRVVHPLVRPSLTREDPLDRPEEALGLAMCLLQEDEWERKSEGLRLVRALAEHHSSGVLPELHSICKAVNKEVKRVRSLVSREAINTMAHLFAYLQHHMDSEVMGAARTLLHKAGVSSLFIREGVELALTAMVHSCSPGRVLRGLLAGGLSHRNPAIRAATAYSLVRLLQEVEVSHVLTDRKFARKLLPAIRTLEFDSAQEVRKVGSLLGGKRTGPVASGLPSQPAGNVPPPNKPYKACEGFAQGRPSSPSHYFRGRPPFRCMGPVSITVTSSDSVGFSGTKHFTPNPL